MAAETEGRVYNVGGEGDWDEVVAAASEASGEERLIVNMGPQHPSTHGVLRLILTLDGETVTELRPVIGYLHTGIEKNMEFRTWTQGVTFCTRADYLAPIFNETAYCLAVARLLGIAAAVPQRAKNVAYLDLAGCMALGVTGPILRATGLPWDLRKSQPYCGYETYEFAVPTRDACDAYDRYAIRMDEMEESLKIIEQCVDRLAAKRPAHDPVMISDAKIGWPAQLAVGADGLGNSPAHIAQIMGQSMEALIHHFKLVTEGFRVPAV